jgi:hypothetical protein
VERHGFVVDSTSFIAATPPILETILTTISALIKRPVNVNVLVTSTDQSINVVGNPNSGGTVVGVIHHVNHFWAFHPRA